MLWPGLGGERWRYPFRFSVFCFLLPLKIRLLINAKFIVFSWADVAE
jgi:hypothetical protein